MVLKIEHLSKTFGQTAVLRNIELLLQEQTVYGLVGLNGAGKTTLIRVILGLLEKDAGEISVLGYAPWKHSPGLYRRMGVVLENDGFFGNMSVRDNLKIFASAKGIKWKDAQSYLDQYWSGTEIYTTEKKVKFLSRGQKVQCGLCRAFLGWPGLCVFDEPAASLDVTAYEHLKMMVREAKSRGAAVIISSHQLETIDDLCDRVGILRNGEIEELSSVSEKKQGWVIASDSCAAVGEILSANGAQRVGFSDGYWRLTVEDSETQIPRFVSELVKAGYQIREVSPEKREFSDSIRNIYNS
ncbi:ABC transporter, ATP-binding protein [Chitinispirillum alkaliphilum]|nr:ABC transporter, ATP-binding protein [Chitinispirillum alkaliphilum]